ncbi:MAG TPA: LamG domain-containing protein [Verrucomicrobiae bacterium]|jgi:hypothetical protein|nr:LamG domain-containing protein [Verrucomicrobiae bacterium]
MKTSPLSRAATVNLPAAYWPLLRGLLWLTAFLIAGLTARAGLSLELHFYRNSQGQNYSFYTPLYTNALSPAAPLGTYIISSPLQPDNGSVRAFLLTENGIQDISSADSEHFYTDFDSAIYQITNGLWSIVFTNATVTNVYQFSVSAPTMTSNMLPAVVLDFPAPGAFILTSETNFSWHAPVPWPVTGFGQVFNGSGYYNASDLPTTQTNWNVDSVLPPDANYAILLQYLYTNTTLFTISTPIDTNSSQPLSGWDSDTVLDTGFYSNFAVVASHGTPSRGHTLLAHYTFEDNGGAFAHDFSENGNDMFAAWFTNPPYTTNDAVAGDYAGGMDGTGWFSPVDGLSNLLTGSFSVSLWVKTTNVFGSDTTDPFSAAGIVSDVSGDYNNVAAPMVQAGHKLGFFTGGSSQNTLYSQSDITTGQFVHVVTTRDQQTGEKRLYVNGVLEASIFSITNLLNGADLEGLAVGYNNGNVFTGEMDEIQFYSGVISSNEVALLHDNPGTNVADTFELEVPAARYDFEYRDNPGADSSGHHNDANCSGNSGPVEDVSSNDSKVGRRARQFFGNTHLCFVDLPMLSNALSGNFSVTAWVKTTNSVDADFANAYFGNPILFAYNAATNGTVPLSITGSKAAFTISNPDGNDTTIHSVRSVNDGRYHFLAVTRNQTNGVVDLYVDGFLEASATANTAPIENSGAISLGGGGPIDYTGLMDDVRIYAYTLAPDDVTTLAGNGALIFATALGTTNLVWSTNGDTGWFGENTNTYNGAAAAAQSGSVTNNQTSTLSATVMGPGILTFAWQNPNQGSIDLEFDIDGQYQNDIGGFTDWTQDGPYRISGGPHTLSWTVSANGDSDPTEAAFLSQVVFIPLSLVAHFNFDDLTAFYPLDVSQNGNDMDYGFGYNGGGYHQTNDAAAGPNALDFFRNPDFSFSGGYIGWNSTPADLLSTLAGTFSVSLWIKTTNSTGSVGDIASDGACILAGDVPGDANDVTPVALTGGAVAFGTGGTPGDDTLTSQTLVNDNNWHHVVVTRNQQSGLKRIYIDGVEDAASPGTGSTVLLNDPLLLSFCSRLNASSANPSAYGPANSYDGLLDDVQIYSRVLSSDEVTFLHNHPGQEIAQATQGAVPVDVQLRLEFHRDYSGNGVQYYVFPGILSVSPAPTTYDEVTSPNGDFHGRTDSSSSVIFTSLTDILQECNSTNWLLVINGGSASEQDLHFSVTVTGLDTDALPSTTIYSPTNGSVNVATNPVFYWSGPANYGGLNVGGSTPPLQSFNAVLPVTATNWTSPPTLNYGTNQFSVSYSNAFPTVTFSVPVDLNTAQPLANWVASAALYSSASSTYVVGAPGPAAVQLIPLGPTPGNFQFSFRTLAGRPHTVQARTNLTLGAWVDLTNFVGDGALWQFTFPKTNPPMRYFRVQTQ